MILEGVLVLSAERDEVLANKSAQALLEICELCAAAYLGGVRRVMVQGRNGEWIRKVALSWFNKLLASRGLARMAVRVVEPGGAPEGKLRAAWEERDMVAARRAAFRFEREAEAVHSLAELQAVEAEAPEALFAAAPVISAEICTGCDACVRACPRDVLTQINDSVNHAHYHINSVSCDACGLCVELCSSGAIKVLTMVKATADIPLKIWACSDCGAPTRAPEVQGRDGGQCLICQSTGHHKKLFQVLP